MTSQTAQVVDFPESWKLLGGRALSAKILLAECDPSYDPLGPENVLVMAPGVLSGTAAPTSGRISIGGGVTMRNRSHGGVKASRFSGREKNANTSSMPRSSRMAVVNSCVRTS